ncbi:ABC transporter substrate-binding protein [Cellulomonas chengniuliangii]|uniref:Sugar ABC transporter substrate-binding protein n=1 Tax=Cellulomonas chengniuliangii TaxID=2968084 RepID=A0ABY5KYY4_9CELL|nr:sugar ABC transporter substrate-binding protein [Cellulomonas chengniuliangii]MCC2309517.1 sugar ABC transporter substrate-binding protein [Cellulomonas chengniuliangii]MCC2316788.1 sugar ABC transporter substrate-binding protein [Cellulomonas chengniuliangii]UUI74925.1 sugar ABC transporter substrate-binding protein [Cellulomonas chengniuliangii]
MRLSSKARLVPVALVTAAALVACTSTGGGGGSAGSEGDGGNAKLTVWSWDGTVELAVPGFEEANPGTTVDVVNVGSSSDLYQSLDNAIQAGTGVPDLVMFEYFAVPYFAIPGKLTDLTTLGAGDLEDDFLPAAWNNVKLGEGVYALPSDYGPAAMFWNSATFAQAGITEAPATWDDYYEAAKKIRALGPDHYIAQDTGDLFFLLSLIWQAGGRPFTVDGTSVKIDFSEPATKKAVDFWQKMLDEDLLNTKVTAWSDDWNRTLNDGSLATQNMGGWLTSTLPERAPDAAGDFRVALMPQWEAGQTVGAENGGSSFGIPEAAQNKQAAYDFLEYFTHGEGLQPRVDAGAFVPSAKVLDDAAFREVPNEYFGGQATGAVLAEASKAAAVGWQYPPFFEWARSIYGDLASPLYTSGQGSLAAVLETWKQRCIAYGNEQGFEVS